MRNKLVAVLLLSTLLNPAIAFAAADEQPQPAGEMRLGDVTFPVSCSEAAQHQFNRSVAILHSFWYEEAVKSFINVTETDPNCAMGYWGVAMSYWYQLWYPPTDAALKEGSGAVAKARSISAESDRERDYIEAIAVFYHDSDKLDHRARGIAYAKAMEQMYQRYPDDREAAVFYALALDATASPTDKSFANQKKAAGILQEVFAEQPNHPGAAHYLIHSYDAPSLAELGLPAAICYSTIAPSVPHALHMPSHIFTRLGKWQDSIASNRAAAAAGQDYARREYGPGVGWDQSLHAMDYLEYAYLQLADDRAANEVVNEVLAFQKVTPQVMAAAYAIAAIPARYAVERRDWAAAASLSPPTVEFPWDRFPWTKAMIAYARALGAARTGNVGEAKIEIDHLQEAHDALIAKNKYWADQIEVQRLAALAMVAHAESRDNEALVGLRKAADLEASMDKNNVTPGGIVPTRELLGDLLLELNQPAQALVAYEQSLASDPNRFRSIYGAAKAVGQADHRAKAKTYYQQLTSLVGQVATERPELLEAKAYLSE